MLSFEQYKKNAMRDLKKALIKGEVDEPIIPLLEIMNSKECLYTTSSCYGRITIDEVPVIDNKRQHRWIGKWHRTVTLNEIKDILLNIKRIDKDKVVYLKQDPFILHIGVRDITTAGKLLKIARDMMGLKRSGIMHMKPRIMIEIMGLDHISMPVIYGGEFLIDLNKLNYIVYLLNTKFRRNEERIKKFFSFVDEYF